MNEGKPAPSSAASEQAHEPVRSCLVHFKLFAPDARTVFLAGTFNDWDTTATQMGLDGFGAWVTDLSLPPGRYEYLFVVDGKWFCDPEVRDYVPNPFGACNSVVQVK